MALTVSALADQAGLSADTVRYYERVGLLPEPARSAAGYRLYDQAAVGRLRLIKGAQRAGLRLRDIGELLQWSHQAGPQRCTDRCSSGAQGPAQRGAFAGHQCSICACRPRYLSNWAFSGQVAVELGIYPWTLQLLASIFHEGRPRCPLTWADAG
jgi:DNA-binding transcriptional MerR regulator